MQTVGEPPLQWRVTLKSGQVLGLVADGYGEVEGHYVFEILVNASEAEQAHDRVILTATTPSDPQRVSVAVAMIPTSEVEKIQSKRWSLPIPVS